jgi:histidinol-phosphate aminotransferase
MTEIKTKFEIDGILPYPLGSTLEEIQKEYGLQQICKMSDNENPYGSSPKVREAVRKETEKVHFYPDGGVTRLIKRIASFYQLPEDHFIIGNGSDEVIRLVTRAYLNKGDEAIVADGTFPRYETNVVIDGGIPVKVPLLHGAHDLTEMLKAINNHTKMVFICNPNNPTGTIVDRAELLSFIQTVPSQVLIVVDEAYGEYVTPELNAETHQLIGKYPNLVVLKTFSKIYGLAGMRIGYGIMDPLIAANLKKVKDVFNVNHLAQVAAMVAIEDQDFIIDSIIKNASERERTVSELKKFDFNPYPSEANFLFIPILKDIDLIEVALLKKGILAKKIAIPGVPAAFRVTLGSREWNNIFLNVMKSFSKESGV